MLKRAYYAQIGIQLLAKIKHNIITQNTKEYKKEAVLNRFYFFNMIL
ncbi:hypothetical protein [Staphylococcus phage vB_SauH_DELF3]|nr:hypothetical protein [Staphylococcus phage vB_SauH_DELF3]